MATHIIIVLHILIFVFLNSKQEDNEVWTECIAGITCIRCYLFLHQRNIDLLRIILKNFKSFTR